MAVDVLLWHLVSWPMHPHSLLTHASTSDQRGLFFLFLFDKKLCWKATPREEDRDPVGGKEGTHNQQPLYGVEPNTAVKPIAVGDAYIEESAKL